MIKNIIFDIGGVLVYLLFEEHLESFGFTKEENQRIAKATFYNKVWRDLDRGTRSFEEVVEDMANSDPELKDKIRQYMYNRPGCIIKKEYSEEWLKTLREKGFNLYYLSDWSMDGLEDFWDQLGFLRYTRGGIFSYREHYLKPEKEIYETLLRRYELIPNECIFIDDVPANVEGANNVGINGILFTTREEVDAKILRLCK